jgi:hypothetical protein
MREHLITACARSFIGTSFVHQGRTKKTTTTAGAIDCIGLILEVAKELRLPWRGGVDPVPPSAYSRTPEGDFLKRTASEYLDPVDLSDMADGDIILFSFLTDPQHAAFAATHARNGRRTIIHAYAGGKFEVAEHTLTHAWRHKISGLYRFPLT